MGWSDSEDRYENETKKKGHRKPRNPFREDEDGADHRQKRSGKRSHRRRTHKDDLWDERQ